MQTDLGTELVDALEGIFGVHPGARRAHAKGRLYDGSFTPTAAAARLSRAPQFASATPLILRFSDAPGVPDISDADPLAPPPGLAIRFLTPDGRPNDVVANANEGFAVRTGEDFVAFLRAVAASGAGVAAPTPLDLFVAAHPETQRFLARPHPTPRSFATSRYFGNNALLFVAADGATQGIPLRHRAGGRGRQPDARGGPGPATPVPVRRPRRAPPSRAGALRSRRATRGGGRPDQRRDDPLARRSGAGSRSARSK